MFLDVISKTTIVLSFSLTIRETRSTVHIKCCDKGVKYIPEAKFSLRPTKHVLPLGFGYLEELPNLLIGHLNYITHFARSKNLFTTILCGHSKQWDLIASCF